MANYGSSTPFILIARVEVKDGKVEEYLALANATDEAVKASEPGMLHHTFDLDPKNPRIFVWSEVYQDDAAFLNHLNNPPVSEYLEKHAKIADSLTIEVYGTVGDECKAAMLSTGLPLTIFETQCGYSRL